MPRTVLNTSGPPPMISATKKTTSERASSPPARPSAAMIGQKALLVGKWRGDIDLEPRVLVSDAGGPCRTSVHTRDRGDESESHAGAAVSSPCRIDPVEWLEQVGQVGGGNARPAVL